MSLIRGLHTSFQGIRDTEAKIATATQNITNADKPGYSRKEYASNYMTVGNTTAPINGVIQSVHLDPYLYEYMLGDSSIATKAQVESEYLSNYVNRLGTVGGNSTVNESLDGIAAALDKLSVTPEDASLKANVVNQAEDMAGDLRDLSATIQDQRLRANLEISDAVESINESLYRIQNLNHEIMSSKSLGVNIADLQDERRVELESIAALTDVEYFVDTNNQMQIYVADISVLSSVVTPLEYTPADTVNSGIVYPGGFSNITIAGVDITERIQGGRIAGLVEVRDTILANEQSKLDEFALQLSAQMNTLLNDGASIPPRSEMIGNLEGIVSGAAFAATGSVRIAITDQNGVVQNYNDFDLTAYATVGDMVTDMNTVMGADLTISINVDGALVIQADNTGQGISINNLDSDIAGSGFSAYFELNNMFDATGAEDISVSEYLSNNSDFLATSRLSSDPALAVLDTGIFIGDGSLSKEMNEAVTARINFNAAGNFSAQTTSLDLYASAMIGAAASDATTLTGRADSAALMAEQTRNELENLIGVNIDEELTRIVDLEAKYEASATIIATIQDLFQELVNAVR